LPCCNIVVATIVASCHNQDVPHQPEFWSLQQAGEFLKVSRFTMMRWLQQGKIPGVRRVGRQWQIPARELRDMIAAGMHPRDSRARPAEPGLPPVWSWFTTTLEESEIERISNCLEQLLVCGGSPPVDRRGLQAVIRGEIRPDAVLWRYLARGAELAFKPRQEMSAHEAQEMAEWIKAGGMREAGRRHGPGEE
jgi:excisionase family DNA binding protein